MGFGVGPDRKIGPAWAIEDFVRWRTGLGIFWIARAGDRRRARCPFHRAVRNLHPRWERFWRPAFPPFLGHDAWRAVRLVIACLARPHGQVSCSVRARRIWAGGLVGPRRPSCCYRAFPGGGGGWLIRRGWRGYFRSRIRFGPRLSLPSFGTFAGLFVVFVDGCPPFPLGHPPTGIRGRGRRGPALSLRGERQARTSGGPFGAAACKSRAPSRALAARDAFYVQGLLPTYRAWVEIASLRLLRLPSTR